MTVAEIAEVGIDDAGRLFVRPATEAFPFIYRAGKQIEWDPALKRLLSPPPSGWSHLDWFRQVLEAVASEYGVGLRLSAATEWTNVPATLRSEIEGLNATTS